MSDEEKRRETELSKIEILMSPEYYFSAQKKTIEQRVKDLHLSEEEEKEIVSKTSKTVIRDNLLGLFKLGEVISTILNWNEQIDSDIKMAKKEYLLANVISKAEATDDIVTKLLNFISDPNGNTIFNKILRILDDSPPDLELADHLSSAIFHIINTKFNEMFSEHKYAISQIEHLTPQALTIIADYKNWAEFTDKSGFCSVSGRGELKSDFHRDFAIAYAKNKCIDKQIIIERVIATCNALYNSGFLDAYKKDEKHFMPKPSNICKSLLPYLAKI